MTISDLLEQIQKIKRPNEHPITAVENFVYQARSLAQIALTQPPPETITLETARTIVQAILLLTAISPQDPKLSHALSLAIKEAKAHATLGKPPAHTTIMGDDQKGGYHD